VISRKGSMAGLLYDSAYSLTRHLFLWTPHDGMQEIGACYGCTSPMAINKNDQVAGNIYSFAIRTWFWSRQTGWFDIGSLGGRGARMSAMNDRGEIVGESADSHEVWHAYFWSPKDGFVDLTPNDWGRQDRHQQRRPDHGLEHQRRMRVEARLRPLTRGVTPVPEWR
jgi:probable HAF family extracellular repeat protein